MTSSPALAELVDLPGVPESTLAPDVAERLPDATPAPPWRCRVRALVWLQRAAEETPAGPLDGRPSLPVTVGALVQYLESPVGPYAEVLASPRVVLAPGLPRTQVPFIAVDSVASVHGGRAHWGLPKTTAVFTGDVHGDLAAVGDGWSVETSASTYGVPLPLVAPLVLEQQAGRPARCGFGGRGRPARVTVRTEGPTLPTWLRSGTWPAIAVTGRLVVGRRAG